MDNFNLKQIVDSGQVFRAWDNNDGTFTFISGDKKITLSQDEEVTDPYWRHYFDLDTDYSKFINAIDPNDKYLTDAANFGSGIRILNQDPWEMLISFIISQQNNIPRIRNCIEKLCEACGTNMGDYYAFPSADEILDLSLDGLYAIGLGFRSMYIFRTAVKYTYGKVISDTSEFFIDEWKRLSSIDLYTELLSLYGVGPKVANCVMLFGYHRLEAFPIDTWMKKIIDREYNGYFDTSKYEEFAGVLQQYMFYYERNKQ